MVRLQNDIPLKVLYDHKLLSSRAFTVCKEIYKEPTINMIIGFYIEYGTFIKVRNCGTGTNVELMSLCKHSAEASEKLEKYLQYH